MDGLTFFKLLIILNKILIKSKLNKITIKDDSIYFSFYKNGVINFEFRCLPTPSSFFVTDKIAGDEAGALSAIAGAVVTDIKSFSYERACYIELKKRKPSGKILEYKAILEPTGNYANFFLTDENGVILYSLSSRSVDPDRNIGVGVKYSKPRANKKYSLDNFSENVSFNEYLGFYPVTSKYADIMAKETSYEETVKFIKNSLLNDEFFYIDKSNKVIPFCVKDYVKKVDYKELSNYFLVKNKDNNKNTKPQEHLKKIFQSKLNKYSKLKDKLTKELELALDYEKYYNEADLIKSNLHLVKGGGHYFFIKYNENNIEKVPYIVSFNEDLNEKADKLYKKALRLKKSIPIINEKLQENNQIIDSAVEQIYFLENSNLTEDFIIFEELINKKSKHNTKKEKNIKNFYQCTFDNYKIFVGKSSLSNHQLVFHYAIDSDVWFHARNIPSSHVILRLNPGEEINNEIITQCAEIVAGFSKCKNESKVDVDYTYRKYVTKPKNTPIGFVTYKKFKTITVTPAKKEYLKEMFSITS